MWVFLTEWHIYGNESQGRIAIVKPNNIVYSEEINDYFSTTFNPSGTFHREINQKFYAIKDHLGSERVVISDVKEPSPNGSKFYTNNISVNNYYPFGSLISDISRSSEDYRYGYNGKENDNEITGKNNTTDYGARTYANRLARFLSTDPLKSKFPSQSSYIYAGNNPILFIDFDGKEQRPASMYQGRVIMAQDQMPNPAFNPNTGNLNSRDGSRPFGEAGFYTPVAAIGAAAPALLIRMGVGNIAREVGEAIFEEATGIPTGLNLKSMFKKGKVGGAFGDILTKKGFHRHHMPAKSASPLKAKEGPAIRMKIKDHRDTKSFGRGKTQDAYRKKQKGLIDKGKFRDAFEMDVQDVRNQFGKKYNKAIKQAKKQMIKVEKKANGGGK